MSTETLRVLRVFERDFLKEKKSFDKINYDKMTAQGVVSEGPKLNFKICWPKMIGLNLTQKRKMAKFVHKPTISSV